jgi:hypothetical protein
VTEKETLTLTFEVTADKAILLDDAAVQIAMDTLDPTYEIQTLELDEIVMLPRASAAVPAKWSTTAHVVARLIRPAK